MVNGEFDRSQTNRTLSLKKPVDVTAVVACCDPKQSSRLTWLFALITLRRVCLQSADTCVVLRWGWVRARAADSSDQASFEFRAHTRQSRTCKYPGVYCQACLKIHVLEEAEFCSDEVYSLCLDLSSDPKLGQNRPDIRVVDQPLICQYMIRSHIGTSLIQYLVFYLDHYLHMVYIKSTMEMVQNQQSMHSRGLLWSVCLPFSSYYRNV